MEKVRNTLKTLDLGGRRVCGPAGCQSSCQVLVTSFKNVAIHAFLTQVVWFVDVRFSAKRLYFCSSVKWSCVYLLH